MHEKLAFERNDIEPDGEKERERYCRQVMVYVYIYIYTRVDPFFFAGSLIKVEVDNLVAMWAHVAM